MSREVRRVPITWKHPVQYNPYWQLQRSIPFGRSRPESRLHGPHEQFVPLLSDYPDALARWHSEAQELAERTGSHWEFSVNWHFGGYDDCSCHPGQVGVRHPVLDWSDDGETEIDLDVTTEDQLHAHLTAKHLEERPDPAQYMPIFTEPAVGWCLYETVSEGTPVTPVFATAEELIEHLATVGQDWDQVPLRRSSAEAIVSTGSTLGSMIVTGGCLLDSTRDADVISEGLS